VRALAQLIYVYAYIGMYVCMYIYIYMYTYMYIGLTRSRNGRRRLIGARLLERAHLGMRQTINEFR